MQSLGQREDLSEKIDAFVDRFSRLQDHIGEKLIPRFAALLGEQPKSLLDVLAYAKKIGWVANAEAFVGARKLRNLLVHEYMADTDLFLEALKSVDEANPNTNRYCRQHCTVCRGTGFEQKLTRLCLRPTSYGWY